MQNPYSIAATLRLNVVFLSDDRDDAPFSEELESSRLLRRQVTEIKAALRQAKELQRGVPQDEADEPPH
jgi:hypothetical protein